MAQIQKLQLQGVRSFGAEEGDRQNVEFFSPLTLILGQVLLCRNVTLFVSLSFGKLILPHSPYSLNLTKIYLLKMLKRKGVFRIFIKVIAMMDCQKQPLNQKQLEDLDLGKEVS